MNSKTGCMVIQDNKVVKVLDFSRPYSYKFLIASIMEALKEKNIVFVTSSLCGRVRLVSMLVNDACLLNIDMPCDHSVYLCDCYIVEFCSGEQKKG